MLSVGAVLAGMVACGPSDPHAGAYQGIVEFDERDLGFQIGGRVKEVAVAEGDAIATGQVLAVLDDTLAQTAKAVRASEAAAARAHTELVRAGARAEDIRAAAAQVEAARAAEDRLETDLARQKRLLAQNATTQAAVDDLAARHRAAIAERRAREARFRALRDGARSQEVATAAARAGAAEGQVDAAGERLRQHQLHALAAGTVLEVTVDPGEVIAAGAPVITVADIDHPYAEVFVPEADIAGIRVGEKAEIAVDSLPAPLAGTVEHIARRTEFTPRFVFSDRERPNLVIRVRVRIDDPRHQLHAGLPAFVNISRSTATATAAAKKP